MCTPPAPGPGRPPWPPGTPGRRRAAPARCRSHSWRPFLLIELRHRYGLGSGPAGSTVDGVLDDEALGPVTGGAAVNLQQVRPEPRVVLTDPAGAEPTCPTRRLGAEPTEHLNSFLDSGGQRCRLAGENRDRTTCQRRHAAGRIFRRDSDAEYV